MRESDKERPGSPISWKRLFILIVFVSGFIAFFVLGGNQYLSFETLKASRHELLEYTGRHYWMILGGALLIYTATTALSIPVATGLSLTVGFLFGRWIGMAIILVSATLGATLVFISARYLFVEAAQRRMGEVARKMVAGFHKHDFNYLLFLRLVPIFPFWLVNLVPAFTPIKIQTYMIATALGILPGCFVFANLGESLGRIDSPKELLSLQTIVAFILLGILALLPVLIKKLRLRNEDEID